MKFNTEEAKASDDFVEKSFTGSIWKQVKDALAEALANAVFHESYREPEPVEIRIYVDSIQIINYLGLAKWIDVEKFATVKQGLVNTEIAELGNCLKRLICLKNKVQGFRKYCAN